MSDKYRDEAAKLEQTVQRHLKEVKDISSDEDEAPFETCVLEGVFRRYETGGRESRLFNRTRNLLEEAISGRTVTCIICIGSIKRAVAIWSCGLCHSYFHLSCIKTWAIDCVSSKPEDIRGPIGVQVPKKLEWCCPMCRQSYSKDQIPRKYRCFCGKIDDPPVNPWVIPHSCGEVCGKRLSTDGHCMHMCLLLCHPGPCPPCPQTVNGKCYCGKQRKFERCSSSNWSCNKLCQKILLCNFHKCEKVCHEGDCPPCNYTSVQPCQCGGQKLRRPCKDPIWQCQKPCNKPFDCGYHRCEKPCHSGRCGFCPNSGMKFCPCGANLKYVQCPDFIGTCLGRCNKKHEDCNHYCPEICHLGVCPPCQVITQRTCFCRGHGRTQRCSLEFRCEKECRDFRDCGQHRCGQICCDGNCPPCEIICDKLLLCGRHNCTSLCHTGPCYPCSQE